MSGLINSAMAQPGAEQAMPPEGAGQNAPQQGLPPKTPATFMTFQVLLHLFRPESAERWAQAAAQDPVSVIAQLATEAVMQSMQAAKGKATPEDAQEALREVISSMTLFLVAAGVVPDEQGEQIAKAATAKAMGGAQAGAEGQPMPQQPPGAPMPQQAAMPGGPMQ